MPGLTFGDWPCLRLPTAQARQLQAEGTIVRTDLPIGTFRLPVGLDHGEGWILLPRSTVKQYHDLAMVDKLKPLRFHNTPYAANLPWAVEIHNLTIIEAYEYFGRTVRELTTEDGETLGSESVVACRVVDPRWWWLRTSTGPGIGGPAGAGARPSEWPAAAYNVWASNGTGDTRNYKAATLRSGQPWTWSQILADLWSRLPFTTQPGGDGLTSPPAWPDAPTWTPENLRFEQRSIWRAICELVDYAHCVIGWDFATKGWAIKRIDGNSLSFKGNTTINNDDGIESKIAGYLIYDARPLIFRGAFEVERVDLFSRRPVDHDDPQPWSPATVDSGRTAEQVVRETTARVQVPRVQDSLPGRDDVADPWADIAARYFDRSAAAASPMRRVYAAGLEINVDGSAVTDAIFKLIENSLTTTLIRRELPVIAPPIRHQTETGGLYVSTLTEELVSQGTATTAGGTVVSDAGLLATSQVLPAATTIAAVDGVVIAYNCEQAGE